MMIVGDVSETSSELHRHWSRRGHVTEFCVKIGWFDGLCSFTSVYSLTTYAL